MCLSSTVMWLVKWWAMAALIFFAPLAYTATQHRLWAGVAQEERFDSGAYIGNREIMSRIGPELGYRLNNEKRKLEAKYGLELVHRWNAQQWSMDHLAAMEYKDRISQRWNMEAQGSYTQLEDMTSIPRFGLARITASAIWAKGGITAIYRGSHTRNIEMAYRGESTRVDLGPRALNISNELWARIREQLSPRWETGARYRFQLLGTYGGRFADSHSTTVSLRTLLGRHTSAMVELGPTSFQSIQDKSSMFMRGNAELTYDARGLYLGLILGRDILGAAGHAPAVWSHFAQVAGTWRFRDHYNLWIGGGYYLNGIAPAKPADAEGWNAMAGVEIKWNQFFSVMVSYDHIVQLARSGDDSGVSREIARIKLFYKDNL